MLSLRALGQHRTRGFTLIELMIVIAILAILATVAVPSFIKYMRRAKTVEAIDQIDKIIKGSVVYFKSPHVNSAGQHLGCRFPASQGSTPTEVGCCADQGGPDTNDDDRCDANPLAWATATWSALSFEMRDEHYFVYAYDSSGEIEDAEAIASAYGDLDCDSTQSTFQRSIFGDPHSINSECSVHTSAAYFVHAETE